MYGPEEARAIRASLANQFIGMVNDIETAELVGRMFGQMGKSVKTTNSSSSSGEQSSNYSSGYSVQMQETNLVRSSEIMTLETGTFLGKTTQPGKSFFYGKPIIKKKPSNATIPLFKTHPTESIACLISPSNKYEKKEISSIDQIIELNFLKIKQESEEILHRRPLHHSKA